MTIQQQKPAYSSVDAFVRAMGTQEGAEQVYAAAGQFAVKGKSYRLTYGESGPVVARVGHAASIRELFRHRLADGCLSSHAERMTRALSGNREALRQCLRHELGKWRTTGPTEGRALAADRILACHEGHGTELDLRDLGLSSLPAAIGMLAQLRTLRLGGNRFDAVPPMISRLTQLRVLGLERNLLCDLPRWLGDLTQLRVLSASHNRLVSWPDFVAGLPHLALLWIEHNGIASLPADFGFGGHRFETFAYGNPFDEWSLVSIDMVMQRGTSAPIHHERNANVPSLHLRARMPAPGRVQHGGIAALLYDAPQVVIDAGAAGNAVSAPQRLTALRELIAEVGQRLASAPGLTRRRDAIMAYRLERLESWLARDAGLYEACTGAIRASLDDCGDALLQALDDAEIAIVEAMLARQQAEALDTVAALGRSLLRLDLLQQVVLRRWAALPQPFDRLTACRMLLAAELALPGETRPISERQWEAAQLSEEHLNTIRDEVLRLESAHDFRRLDTFMAEWAPWQQQVRRLRAGQLERLNTLLQDMLENADALVRKGELPAKLFDEIAAGLPRHYELTFRVVCREAYRAYRLGLPAGDPMGGARQRPAAAHATARALDA